MIEKMKKVTIITLSERREKTVSQLRDLGVLHIVDLVTRNDESENTEKRLERLNSVQAAIRERLSKKEIVEFKELSHDEVLRLSDALYEALAEKKSLVDLLARLYQERERTGIFGSFNPDDLKELEKDGICLNFYQISDKDKKKLASTDKDFITLSEGRSCIVASVNCILTREMGAQPVGLPERRLEDVESEILLSEMRVKEIDKTVLDAKAYLKAFSVSAGKLEDEVMFLRAKGSFKEEDSIIHLQGYVPEKWEDRVRKAAHENSWALLLEDPGEEDAPPTLLKYKGFVRIIKPVFDILGTVPGYRERDISSYFLVFFSIFFAMIIGDAGYGLIFLLAGVLMNIKARKASDLNILIYVLGFFTLVWGALTGTWFGSEYILMNVPFLQKLVIPSLTNYPAIMGVDPDYAQSMMMKFCFILGVIQLSLACVLNITEKIKNRDLSFVADLGWLINVLVLYLLVLFLAVGETVDMKIVASGVATGFLLVCVFSGQGPGIPFLKGLVSGLGGFFTTFLDTVSCFSNIMSYIRLFAVGMASLAIAQSFNGMAEGMLSGFALPAGILVILLGHTLNLVMGLLSVVVHGVRLNLLEFSGQLGMEWSGYNYEPFGNKATDNII